VSNFLNWLYHIRARVSAEECGKRQINTYPGTCPSDVTDLKKFSKMVLGRLHRLEMLHKKQQKILH